MDSRKPRKAFSYSSQHGALCSICFEPQARCRCQAPTERGDGIVRVGRATQGRKGAGVTTVSGLGLPPAELKALAKELKQRCGSGGTVRDGVIEVQGEHRDRILEWLQQRGYRTKRSGA